jgi:hypothetical protein
MTNQNPSKTELDAMTVAQARAFLKQRMDGRRCPCCTRVVKLYRRYITTSMAISLAEIYRYFKQHPEVEWLHVQNHLGEMKSHGARGGDVSKLRFWGLLERKMGDARKDGSAKVGLYKLTDLGREFVRGNTRVPKYVYLFGNMQYPAPPGDPSVSFREAIGEKFDYSRLMDVEPPKPPPAPTMIPDFKLEPPPTKPHKPVGMHMGGRRG